MEERGGMGVGEMKQPLYVCIYVPEFPTQALMRFRPELSQTPVAILAGEPPLQQVCSANAYASSLGICEGMTRAELDSFKGLKMLPRSTMEERTARSALLHAAGAFTPRIEVQPSSASTFVMVLDMTGSGRIFGSPSQTLGSIAHSFAELRFSTQLAASANLQAAVCVAPSARKAPAILPNGQEREYLRNLSLLALNLTAQHMETLSMWGLQTLGELADLPEVDLVVRLGQEGMRLRLLARGEHPHLMVPEEPVFTLEEFRAFDSPVEMIDSLLFVLAPMLDQLLTRAQNRAFALASATVTLGLEGGGKHERTVKPALPVADREVLLKLLHLDLQGHPPPAGVMSVIVSAEPGDRSKVQLGLFAPQLPEPLRLDVTLARIAALVGEERVGRAKLQDTHRPEGFVMERFVVAPATKKRGMPPHHAVAIRRCRPPRNLAMQCQVQRPSSFALHAKRFTVEEAYGPWRTSGDWWSSEVWSREEWDVRAASTDGETLLCVITHDLLRHSWALEALYD